MAEPQRRHDASHVKKAIMPYAGQARHYAYQRKAWRSHHFKQDFQEKVKSIAIRIVLSIRRC